VAGQATSAGFKVKVANLDSCVRAARGGADVLPKNGAVVIVSSTYNGTPPDNASAFAKWLDEQKEGEWVWISACSAFQMRWPHSLWAALDHCLQRYVWRWVHKVGSRRCCCIVLDWSWNCARHQAAAMPLMMPGLKLPAAMLPVAHVSLSACACQGLTASTSRQTSTDALLCVLCGEYRSGEVSTCNTTPQILLLPQRFNPIALPCLMQTDSPRRTLHVLLPQT
jgi:hypothetical protein